MNAKRAMLEDVGFVMAAFGAAVGVGKVKGIQKFGKQMYCQLLSKLSENYTPIRV